MSQYQAIKAATNAYIKTNGRQEITGAILNAVMIATIDSLGKFYQFVGSAIPTTDPGNFDQNIAYIAGTPGTYTKLGGVSIGAGELAVIKFDGEWHKEVVIVIPSKVSELENDLGFITNAVSDLVNYYTKSETFSRGEISTILSNYYDKAEVDSLVATITQQSYIVAWDGTGVPVVSQIPAGVSVTYGGTPYTGTLAASASTANKIYMVSNGSGYDLYVTTENGGYSWASIGSTNLDLSGYVTQGQFSQLEAEVNGVDETSEVLIPKSLTADGTYNTNVSTMATSPSDNEGYYCTRIAVTPGEVYRLSGVRSSSKYTLLFATANSSRSRLRRDEIGDGSRGTIDVTIETGEAWLYVNLGSYNSATDGVWKVTQETEHTDGIVDDIRDLDERVTALENAPASSVVDNLESTSTTDALSANQGRILNEDINGVTTISYVEQEILVGRYCNTSVSRITSKQYLPSGEDVACVYAYVQPGDVFRIYGKGNAAGYQLYAMADSDRYIVENGTPGVAMDTRENPLELTIPAGVARLCVNLYEYDPLTDKVEKRITTTTECVKTRLNALEREDSVLSGFALPLKGKKVMFFGDSITDFSYEERGVVSYFQEASQATCHNAAVGGTRLSQRTTPVDNPTSTNKAYAALDICNMVKAWCDADYTKQDAATDFLDNYSSRVTALKENPISGVDIVVIGGGTNDITAGVPLGSAGDSSLSTINGAVNQIVTMLLTANPALKIYFWSPIVGYSSNVRTSENWTDNHLYSLGKTRPQMVDLIEDMVKSWHIPYINLYWDLGWNEVNFSNYFVDSDSTHPYKGFDVIGRRLYHRVLSNME